MWGRYTVVYEGDPSGVKILSGEPAPGRAITVMLGDQWEEVRALRVRATVAEATLREREAEIEKLKIAFHDAIRRPLGVTPDSGAEFYDPRMADEAEARRAEARVLWWLPGGGVTR